MRSWRSKKFWQGLTVFVSFGVGGGVLGGVSSLFFCVSAGFEGVESKFSSKLNNPKVSITKKSPKIKKIP
jgi:hypothetical protein